MKVIFTGVGDAFDGNHTNVSLWIEAQPDSELLSNQSEYPGRPIVRILMDCGFTVPYALWQYALPTDELDIVLISHFHGDHFCGLAPLMTKMWLQKRTKDLHIVTPAGGKKK